MGQLAVVFSKLDFLFNTLPNGYPWIIDFQQRSFICNSCPFNKGRFFEKNPGIVLIF